METQLIAYCGLYCSNCFKYKKGACTGCKDSDKNSWCKIKQCAHQQGFVSCADCNQPGYEKCSVYNNFIGKIFGLVFNSNRGACIQLIRDEGYSNYQKYMTENGLQTIPRRLKKN